MGFRSLPLENTRQCVIRSTDNGETWSQPIWFDSPGTFYQRSHAQAIQLPDGGILWPTYCADQGKKQLFGAVHRSDDSGLTWRTISTIRRPEQDVDEPAVARFKDKLLVMVSRPDGGIFLSNDDGVSWKWLAEIQPREGDSHHKYHELHAVETEKGRLVAHIRNHNTAHAGETLQSESEDGGRSWSVPHSIGVWGLPSHLLRLRDGRLLMSYGYRRPPYGNQARISEDEGRSWSAPVSVSADGRGHDLGYPSTVQLGDESFVTVWYERMKSSPRAVLRQARWTLL